MSRQRYKDEALKTITIQGNKYDINVDSDGEFTCRVGVDFLKTDTLKEMIKLVGRSARKNKVEVAIPAMLIGARVRDDDSPYSHRRGVTIGFTCKPITVIGIDNSTNELKYRDADGHVGKRERFGFDDREYIGKPMTPAEVKEWLRLRKEKHAAADAFSTFNKKFEFKDLHGLVKDALNAAVDDPKETPEADEDPR